MFSKASPNFARKGHQQLTGSDADEKDRIIAGVQYSVRYIGSTEVAGPSGTGSAKTEIPVAKVFDQQRKKTEAKTHKKMVLTLCSKSLSVSEEASGKLVANFPISKITFCNIDSFYEKAFVFIARDKPESQFKAFVFTCESKAKSRELFKAVSLAFMINYESYQASLARSKTNGSPGDERKNTFFNGMAGEPQASEEKSEHVNNGVSPPRKSSAPVMNGFHSPKHTRTPSPVAHPQNKNLLRVVSNNRLRSASDPPPSGRANASVSGVAESRPSSLNPATPKNCEELEEEFTEFAELRSKYRSSSELTASSQPVGNFPNGAQRFDSAPNVWGGFQSHVCVTTH